MRNRSITRAVRPLGYQLSAFNRPHIYLPLHGPTLGTDPSDRTYVDDKAGRLTENGGSALLSPAGQLPANGTPPASIWSDNPGWFTPDATENSVFRERHGNSAGDSFALQSLARMNYSTGGLLIAFWHKAPTTAYLDSRSFILDCGFSVSNGGGWGIETVPDAGRLRMRYYGGGGQRAAGVVNMSGIGEVDHFAWFFSWDDEEIISFVNGVQENVASLFTPLGDAAYEEDNFFTLGARSTDPTLDNFNTDTATSDANSAVSDILIVRYTDDVFADIPAVVYDLAMSARGDIPRSLAAL